MVIIAAKVILYVMLVQLVTTVPLKLIVFYALRDISHHMENQVALFALQDGHVRLHSYSQ